MFTRTRLSIALYVHCFVGCGLNSSVSEQGPATRFEDDDVILSSKKTTSIFFRKEFAVTCKDYGVSTFRGAPGVVIG